MSRTYRIKNVHVLPVSLATAWDFFSRAENLQKITPQEMAFTVTSEPGGDHIYPGQVIEYTLKPLLGISMYWMTEITHVKEQVYFVDEQRFGPYSLWHHQHHFREVENGVEMTDLVHYRIPYGFIGDLANIILVKKQLHNLFGYRTRAINERFDITSGRKLL
jgi:ligand-binding SRPBCC domain-containing protein